MKILIEAYTNIPEVYIDVFEFIDANEKIHVIDSDGKYYDRDVDNLKVDIAMIGVYRFDRKEEYLNGQGEMLSKLLIKNCQLYFEEFPKENPWFYIKNITIEDGESKYSLSKENFAEVNIIDIREQSEISAPPLNKVMASLELQSFVDNKSKWDYVAKGFDNLNAAKDFLDVNFIHTVNKYKIKDKLLCLKVIYSAYSAISLKEEYLESDECKALFDEGELSVYDINAEYPTFVIVRLDRKIGKSDTATLLIRDKETLDFLNSELCGVADCIQQLECIDGKIIDSSWIVSVCDEIENKNN